MEFPDLRILVFTRAPVPGQVKTRLTPAVTPELAARIHLALLERTMVLAVGASLAPVELWVADDPHHRTIGRVARHHGVPILRQAEGDLGERMGRAAAATLATGHLPLIIGSDCPEMDGEYLRHACVALSRGTDVVLGPAEDGGYVLIGLAKEAPEVFREISWGSPAVMGQTRQRVRESGLASHELATLWDVDRPADLERLDLPRLLAGGNAW